MKFGLSNSLFQIAKLQTEDIGIMLSGSGIDPTIMLSIYHVHVAIMLSYGNRVIQISISFPFAEINFFF